LKNPDSPFYLSDYPKYGHAGSNGDIWFINQSMGKNKLSQSDTVMEQKGELTSRHTNHSGRKTCIYKTAEQ